MIERARVRGLLVLSLALLLPGVSAAQSDAEGKAATLPTEEASQQSAAATPDVIAADGETSQDKVNTASAGPPPGQERPNFREISIERKSRQITHRVNSRISRYLTAAMETQEEGDVEKGLKLIQRLNPKRLNPMERASVYQIEAMLHYGAGDLDKTIESFRKVIDEEILPLEQETKIRFNIAQLLAGLYRWENAIEAIYEWFRWTQNEDPLAYYLLGIANFQLGNFDLAIANTEKALEIADEPKEGWLQLLAALYVQGADYKRAAPVLEELLTRFPKKAYWVQIGLVYGALENFDASLAVQQIAYEQGLLTEDKELQRLARAYLVAELPYPAAKVLEKGIEDGSIESDAQSLELLANSWIQAREFKRSLPVLTRAAESSDDGNLFIRLGQVYLQGERWADAANAFEKAIEKGGLKKPGSALLLLGIANYNDGQAFRAKSWFISAAKHDSTRKEAEQWIAHLEKEAETS